ncbi:hypothetical protein C8R45DRAFT_388665 [Mycena sanguinolenta]|nr:hypothetical protein C8R45DRAFT_388665 [Mycena sanguinolenta]
MQFVIQNHWPYYAPFHPVVAGSPEGASYESSGASYDRNILHKFPAIKRRREEIEGRLDLSLLAQSADKRRRLNEHGDEIEIIPSRNLKLIREIGNGPGYFIHAGQNNGRAVIAKVFNRGHSSTVRRQLESTVALSKGLMHPNLLRLLGISSPASLSHFIVYENGPLAMALKTDLKRSITLGFKMVAGLSAGLNYLLVQGVFVRRMGVQNFDISLDIDDRFVISVHPRLLEEEESDTTECQDRERNVWVIFNALCNKTLTSANRVLHHEDFPRDPAILDGIPLRSTAESPVSLTSSGSASSQEGIDVPPRREYAWRTMDCGRQSLENIARRMTLNLDMHFSSLSRINQTDGRTPHRCAGYVPDSEEITLATTIFDSVVVACDAPSPLERCLICQEIVDLRETFRCKCGDPAPGTRHTIKCQACKFWSHSDCVGNSTHEFTCWLCLRPEEPSKSLHSALDFVDER